MKIKEVVDKKDWKRFHSVPHLIYKGDANWICPLESDIQDIFDPTQNKAFDHGEAKCFILLNDKNKAVGRIAAFIDKERNQKQEYPTGGVGFFECINDEAHAFQLFETAENYLKSKGVKAIDGPVNFGERDKFWGLLVKGFDPPIYQENYHPTYYQALFEKWGFKPYEQILTLKGVIKDVPIDRFKKISQRSSDRYGITSKHFDLKNLSQTAEDIRLVYNEAFKHFLHFKPLPKEQILKLLSTVKPIINPKQTSIAYCDGIPVGFNALLPDINPILKGFKGKLRKWQLPYFLLKLKMRDKLPLKGVAFGTHVDYQRKGVFAVLVDKAYTDDIADNFDHFVLATIRGHNEIMVKTTSNLGCKIDKVHIAYRKMLDESIAFEPFPFAEVED